MHTTVEREVRVCDPCFNLYGPKEEAGARPAAQQQKKPLWYFSRFLETCHQQNTDPNCKTSGSCNQEFFHINIRDSNIIQNSLGSLDQSRDQNNPIYSNSRSCWVWEFGVDKTCIKKICEKIPFGSVMSTNLMSTEIRNLLLQYCSNNLYKSWFIVTDRLSDHCSISDGVLIREVFSALNFNMYYLDFQTCTKMENKFTWKMS